MVFQYFLGVWSLLWHLSCYTVDVLWCGRGVHCGALRMSFPGLVCVWRAQCTLRIWHLCSHVHRQAFKYKQKTAKNWLHRHSIGFILCGKPVVCYMVTGRNVCKGLGVFVKWCTLFSLTYICTFVCTYVCLSLAQIVLIYYHTEINII
jgi:hypothetical protein